MSIVMVDTDHDGNVVIHDTRERVFNPPEFEMHSRGSHGRLCFHYQATMPDFIIIDTVWLDQLGWQLQSWPDRKVMAAKRFKDVLVLAYDSIQPLCMVSKLTQKCDATVEVPPYRWAYKLRHITWPHSENHEADIDVMLGIKDVMLQ